MDSNTSTLRDLAHDLRDDLGVGPGATPARPGEPAVPPAGLDELAASIDQARRRHGRLTRPRGGRIRADPQIIPQVMGQVA